MVRRWTVAALALASFAQAQTLCHAQPAPQRQPSGGPPAQRQAPAQDPAQEAPRIIKPVTDLASETFVAEHPVCAAYFTIAAGCLAPTDPERVKLLDLGRTVMNRALAYEKEQKLPAGTIRARAEEAQKSMKARVWECSTLPLVIGDLTIPCQVLAEDPEARMRVHLLEAADKLGREGPPAAQQPAPKQ
jgi:hypothetical protein